MANDRYLGIDLGGTKCGIGVYSGEDLTPQEYTEFATHAHEGFPAVFATLAAEVKKLAPTVQAVGIGVPGGIGPQGAIHVLPNIPGAENFELNRELQLVAAKPVFSGNDAQLFTLAESVFGAGKNIDVLVGVTLGTGVGGGIVIHGKLFKGNHGTAGEFGHMLLNGAGNSLREREAEALISGTALHTRGITCVSDAYLSDLADVLASIHSAYDPGVIVLGGSVAKPLRAVLPQIHHLVQERILIPRLAPEIRVTDISHPGCLGAALFARQQLLS